MKILINDEIDKSLWNKFAQNRIFFRYEWLYVIKESYGLEPFFMLCYQNDKFALIGSFKTHKGYISLPFVSYSGFLSNDENLLEYLKKYLKQKNIDIDSRDLQDKEVTSGYVNPIATFYDMDDFWKKIQPRFRSLLRKSEKKDFTFMANDTIEKFYPIYSLGMRNLGTPNHGKRYFYNLQKNIPSVIFTISKDSTTIGSMYCVTDKETLCVMYAYVLPEFAKEYANYFLYLNVIKWMIDNGLIHFDMGRSTYGEGTYHFKKKFRPKFYAINSRIHYSSSTTMRLASSIWKKLPLCVADTIGPKLRKFLP